MYMTRLLPTVAAAAICLGTPALAPAQVVTVDEGSFTITRNGQAAGREDFRIRSTPAAGGAEFVASATVSLGDRRLSPDLRADGRGSLIAYRLETRAGGDTEERLTGQVGRGRFSAQLKTPRGESTREYVVSNGALVLDDDVYHQYYFLAIGGRSGAVPVVIPRRNVQVTMQIQRQGTETVSAGGQDVDATHLLVSEPGGERHVWVDGRGRVLKVTVPARGIVVVRDEPPR
jgi:hypothetical protein